MIMQIEEDIKANVDETKVSEMINEANIEHKSGKVVNERKEVVNERKEVVNERKEVVNERKEVVNERKEVVKDQTMETKEREKRLNYIIIFSLTEANSQLKSNLHKHDREALLELCT